MNFSPYHSKSRESREGTDEKVTKIYTSVGDASKKTRCHSPKIHLCLYFSNSKTRQEIHKAICSSEIAILPSTRNKYVQWVCWACFFFSRKVKLDPSKENFQNNELFYVVSQIHAGGGQ